MNAWQHFGLIVMGLVCVGAPDRTPAWRRAVDQYIGLALILWGILG